MRTDPKYRRDVRAALKRKREAQRAAEQRKSQRLAAKQAKASTTKTLTRPTLKMKSLFKFVLALTLLGVIAHGSDRTVCARAV
jgi:hypothetical protein